jgi:hypothetical protein
MAAAQATFAGHWNPSSMTQRVHVHSSTRSPTTNKVDLTIVAGDDLSVVVCSFNEMNADDCDYVDFGHVKFDVPTREID